MKQGVSISGGLHLALLALVLFNGAFFKSRDAELIQVAEVSLISAEAFDAAASGAPDVPAVATEDLQPPREPASDAVTPQADVAPDLAAADNPEAPAAADAGADLSGVQALLEPSAEALEAPAQPDQVADDAAPLGESLIEPVAIGNDAPSETIVPPTELAAAEALPNDAPRIDTESAPEQPDDAVTSEEVTPEVTEQVATDVVVEEPQPAEAPTAATTVITPDAVDQPLSAFAPPVSSRPRGRPADLLARVDAAREAEARALAAAAEAEVAADAEAEAQADADAGAAAIEAALRVVSAEPAAEAAVESTPTLGSSMTAGEKDGLRLAVQKCWNVPAGLANAAELVVVVGVELAQDGALAGSPFLIEPAGEPGDGFRQAFEAGRRALIRCAPYDLPADKYEQWRNLEVVFNPKNMVVR